MTEYIRELASGRQGRSTTVRQFRVPTFNFAAIDYVDLISSKETSRCLELVNLLVKGCCHKKKFRNLSRTKNANETKPLLNFQSLLVLHMQVKDVSDWSQLKCHRLCDRVCKIKITVMDLY